MRHLIFSLLLTVMIFLTPGCAKSDEAGTREALVIQTSDGKLHEFQVEIADTAEVRAKDLMFRESLEASHGMLFVFDGAEETEQAFWMKNTLIPLDMLFIRSDGTVRKVHEMAKPQDKTVIKSDGPVKAGLEIGGGIAKKLNIQQGAVVHHRIFGNELAAP